MAEAQVAQIFTQLIYINEGRDARNTLSRARIYVRNARRGGRQV